MGRSYAVPQVEEPKVAAEQIAGSVVENSVRQEQLLSGMHVVRPGETLSGIAADRLGEASEWRSLYEENQEVIGPDPDRILPGQCLKLSPRAPGECVEPIPELDTSVDVSALWDDELDSRIAEWLGLIEEASPEQYQAMLPHLAKLQREREGRQAFSASSPRTAEEGPDRLLLPEPLQEGMETAWKGSVQGDQVVEQGGILVSDPDFWRWKAGDPGTEGSFTPNFDDVEWHEQALVLGHTHPYEEGHTDVSFSEGDLANFVTQPVARKIVRSGDSVFVVTRTREFEKWVAGLDDAGKDELQAEMKFVWESAYQGHSGSFQESVEAAVIAVCEEFELAYYKGSGDELARVSP